MGNQCKASKRMGLTVEAAHPPTVVHSCRGVRTWVQFWKSPSAELYGNWTAIKIKQNKNEKTAPKIFSSVLLLMDFFGVILIILCTPKMAITSNSLIVLMNLWIYNCCTVCMPKQYYFRKLHNCRTRPML